MSVLLWCSHTLVKLYLTEVLLIYLAQTSNHKKCSLINLIEMSHSDLKLSDFPVSCNNSGKCQRIPLMSSQNWIRSWLDAVRHQAITWANVDPYMCHNMVSLGHSEFENVWMILSVYNVWYSFVEPLTHGLLPLFLSWAFPAEWKTKMLKSPFSCVVCTRGN